MLSESNLPTSTDELRALCLSLQSTITDNIQALLNKDSLIKDQKFRLAYLEEQLKLLQSKRYQSSSETLNNLQSQLFDESELEQAIQGVRDELADMQVEASVDTDSSAEVQTAKKTPKRQTIPAHLRRVEIIIDVSDEDKQMMGDQWEAIGYDISEQVAVKQREYYVKCYKRVKYVRQEQPLHKLSLAHAPQDQGIKVAPRPKVMLPKAIADASLLADVIASKFVDALSFYRKNKILKREGIEIGYSTICDWPIQLARQLESLKRLLYEQLPISDLWHLDETTLQVLQEPNRDNHKTSYIWGIRTGSTDQPVILFHYDSRRSYAALEEWLSPYLGEFKGIIITDEYAPYNKWVREHSNIQGHGGCWAHLRRKFSDAAKGRKDTSEAHKILAMIAVLYKKDKTLKHLSGDEKRLARQDKIKPQVEHIKRHLEQLSCVFVNKGLMHTAIRYGLNNWAKFTAFLDHPILPLDNNAMEQTIRPFTLGRKNWLFSGSPRGADASVFLYSLIETAKANGWEPKAYLQTLFERYPFATSDEQRRELLPMFLKPSK